MSIAEQAKINNIERMAAVPQTRVIHLEFALQA